MHGGYQTLFILSKLRKTITICLINNVGLPEQGFTSQAEQNALNISKFRIKNVSLLICFLRAVNMLY